MVQLKLKQLKKEQKHYHFDWNSVDDEGARFENLVACHLLKWCNYFYDTEGRELELRYFRDIAGREVDFIIIEKRKPIIAVECKSSDKELSKALLYFKNKYPEIKAYQTSRSGVKDVNTKEGIRIMPANKFLSTLV